MRVIVAGGGDVGRYTAESLAGFGHEVIVIEENEEVCRGLASELDIIVLCGDATKPVMFEKAEVERTELVIALTDSDQENLIAALIAKEYGVKRVIVKLDDPGFNIVCHKLGLEEIVNPKLSTAQHIADMARKPHAIEVSTLVGGSIRVFSAIVRKKEHIGLRIDELDLPGDSLLVVLQRGAEFFIAKGGFKLLEGDHLNILCEEKTLEKLVESFG